MNNQNTLQLLLGEWSGTGMILRMQSTAFLNDTRMLQTSRTIIVEGDSLHYTLDMHTTAVPQPAHHVEGRLNRIS